MLRIYYNPKCSKSRAALARIEAAGLEPEVCNYLTDPPTREQLDTLLDKLADAPVDLLRDMDGDIPEQRDAVIAALLDNPRHMQRPVVETDTAAIIARPPERVDAFLDISPDMA